MAKKRDPVSSDLLADFSFEQLLIQYFRGCYFRH